jgi:hypothetical protein
MNERLGKLGGEHVGQYTRTYWVGVLVTTIAAGAVGTKDKVGGMLQM